MRFGLRYYAFWHIFSKYGSLNEMLNAKGNGNGKRGKGQNPTGQTTCGREPRTATHATYVQVAVGKTPFPSLQRQT
jgi:hypothetical protein